jgi:glycine hydroxymethyltransferase
MSHSSFPSSLLDADAQVAALISAEERRQREKIILIPSESLTPPAVREALGSVLTSIYAEGYPRKAMMALTSERLADLDEQLASYRRYADRRFYKGTEIADLVESLAARRAAECFATDEIPSEQIRANVQALSGAAANLAVYETFVEPGETVMGMALTEGGHLTHGSPFSVTGKRYRIVSYAVDPKAGRLDYDTIERMALEHEPKMIIGGFTSYPWRPDWARFRQIADRVGAILLADIAHTAGMVVGGVYPSPLGHAHVTTFTTHKTLCGPRGAVILSTDPEIADRIDTAIFPGQQGGPHVNKFAGIAVALKLARSPEFTNLQHRIVENASSLADALQENGLALAYGGTDTHLLLVDLRELPSDTGFTMMGEVASRILELVGIVCNKNTLPGDTSASDAHGIRLGTPWATQRGMGTTEMRDLAKIISDVLHAIRPFSYIGLTGDLSRGKLPISVLDRASRDVRALVRRIDPDAKPLRRAQPTDGGDWTALHVRAGRVRALLNEATPADLFALAEDASCSTYLFDEEGQTICEVVIRARGDDEYVLFVPRADAEAATAWLVGLAEGYTLFDPDDVFRKVQGPAAIEKIDPSALTETERAEWKILPPPASLPASIEEAYAHRPERFALAKPYFVGQSRLEIPAPQTQREDFAWVEPESETLRKTPLHEAHVEAGAKLVPFAGWEMPVRYTSTLEEHRAVRERAGLFDLGHMGVFQVEGDGATEFLNVVTSNYAAWLEDGCSQYAYLLDASGDVLDDIFVYRRDATRYLLVVNATNERKGWAWLNGVNEGRFAIDAEAPGRKITPRVTIRDLKAERGVIDIALQGPLSRPILERILDPADRGKLGALERTGFAEFAADGHQLIAARTGYTGEPQGYEIYVGGPSARWLWDRLLEVGEPEGLARCGLGARDSTRTEAGFPLYGFELAGPHRINPFEAGFGPYLKLHKPFFIGRSQSVADSLKRNREVIRFGVEEGARPIRTGAALLDRNGGFLGHVTSCVTVGSAQVGLALAHRSGLEPETPIALLNPQKDGEKSKGVSDLRRGDRVSVSVRGEILPRFLSRDANDKAEGS